MTKNGGAVRSTLLPTPTAPDWTTSHARMPTASSGNWCCLAAEADQSHATATQNASPLSRKRPGPPACAKQGAATGSRRAFQILGWWKRDVDAPIVVPDPDRITPQPTRYRPNHLSRARPITEANGREVLPTAEPPPIVVESTRFLAWQQLAFSTPPVGWSAPTSACRQRPGDSVLNCGGGSVITVVAPASTRCPAASDFSEQGHSPTAIRHPCHGQLSKKQPQTPPDGRVVLERTGRS